MRIIGGEWGGRKLEEPRGRDVTRPTTDRVREACASMAESALDGGIEGSRILDAFGGSGALGIEMLSRGAAASTVFDADRGAAALIKRNLAALKCAPSRSRVICGDILTSAARGRVPGAPFDLVLLDPPYAFGAEPVEKLLCDLASHELLSPGCVILFEHAAGEAGAHPDGFETLREKRYGITAVDVLVWRG